MIPYIEENLGALSEKETGFVRMAELAAIDKHLESYRWIGNGDVELSNSDKKQDIFRKFW